MSNPMDQAAADAQRDALAHGGPGAQAHVPGEDHTDSSVGGVVPDGGAVDRSADDAAPGDGGLSNAGDGVGGDDVVGDAGLDDDSDTEDAVEDLDDQDDLADRAPVGDSFGEGPE
ncbi:hypothetical protein IFU30_04625 [Plantibacter sp. CFBP 8798]|uniref:hypothetical protein n=1 Tax=Plantibacter sp. CFBP 8798 TaxID=2775268 RepID=UPI001781097F|nr:hypothetical protein [Plantibacter sp. CFBP 8798]MBD8465550.1 hypothetical protein [Plantibacter sp. CFBP 8798]